MQYLRSWGCFVGLGFSGFFGGVLLFVWGFFVRLFFGGFLVFLSIVLLFVFETGTSTKNLGAYSSRSFKMMMPWFEEYVTSSLWVNVHMRKYWLKLNISDERANRMPPTALWAVSVTKSHNIGTILSLISWFRNSLGEKWALIVSKLVSLPKQQPRYFSSTVWRWKHAQVFALQFEVMFICKLFAVLLSISAHTGIHPLSRTHALPQLPAQNPANTIFQLCTERVKSRERH